MAKMVEKVKHSLKNIIDKGGYKLGIVGAKLKLPKLRTTNPDGTIVTFAPEQNHRPYLDRSNAFPILPILESQDGLYGEIRFEDKRVIAIAEAYSPYVLEGEHLILWALSGDNTRFQPNITYLSDDQGKKLFSTAASIAEIYERKGLTFMIGINSNDKEYERQSVQSIRDGAHVHCVGIDKKDVIHFEELAPSDDKRILNDPFSMLANRILEKSVMPKVFGFENADSLIKNMVGYSEYPYEYPKGTSLVLKEGLKSLKNPNFFKFIQQIHQLLENEFNQLVSCFTDGNPDTFRAYINDDTDTINFFSRPLPLPKNEIQLRLTKYLEDHPELGDDHLVAQGLRYIGKVLKSALTVIVENTDSKHPTLGIPIVDAKIMNSRIIMKGLSYNMLVFTHPDTGEVLLSFVPRITTGGSPLDSIGIKKVQYSVSEDEFKVHISEMARRLNSTVSMLMKSESNIRPRKAVSTTPKVKPEF